MISISRLWSWGRSRHKANKSLSLDALDFFMPLFSFCCYLLTPNDLNHWQQQMTVEFKKQPIRCPVDLVVRHSFLIVFLRFLSS